jgi:hypothetical protein
MEMKTGSSWSKNLWSMKKKITKKAYAGRGPEMKWEIPVKSLIINGCKDGLQKRIKSERGIA